MVRSGYGCGCVCVCVCMYVRGYEDILSPALISDWLRENTVSQLTHYLVIELPYFYWLPCRPLNQSCLTLLIRTIMDIKYRTQASINQTIKQKKQIGYHITSLTESVLCTSNEIRVLDGSLHKGRGLSSQDVLVVVVVKMGSKMQWED